VISENSDKRKYLTMFWSSAIFAVNPAVALQWISCRYEMSLC